MTPPSEEPAAPPPGWRFDFAPEPARAHQGEGPAKGQLLAGRYRLLAELGRGGLAVVHRALDLETGREVALKVVRGKLTSEGRERLRREALLGASLDHEGIVGVLGSGEAREGPFLVHELVPGATTLESALPGLDRARRLAVFGEVVRAIRHAHERGVVHRDLKAANVLLDGRG